jgi:hypothetical protein
MLELVDRKKEIREIRAETNEMETKKQEQPPQQIYTYIYKKITEPKDGSLKKQTRLPKPLVN